MPRIFLPLEVDFDDDDKVSKLASYTRPHEARALRDLLVGMWRYCKRNVTDGHVPLEQVGKLVYPDSPRIGKRDADRLVDVGLAEATEHGYYLPGYLKRNKSRAQLDAEAAVKKMAGRKGGLRSGEVRRNEAHSQADNEAERSSVLRTSEAIDIDIDTSKDLREERPEPLNTAAATDLPQSPSDARCAAHRGVTDPPPCVGCRNARERAERRAEREADQRARELEAAIRNCPDCEGTGKVLNADKLPSRKTCTHPNVRRTA